MDQTKDEPPTVNPTDKVNINVEDIKIIEEEEEEASEKQSESHENVENPQSLLDEITQTDSTAFEKNNDQSDKNELAAKQEDEKNKYENFLEREFYPQFNANEQKIESQIDKIDQAIEKLRLLTNSLNRNPDSAPSTSTSASIDRLSESLQINNESLDNKTNIIHKTKKRSVKKTKAKSSSKPFTTISYDPNIRRKPRKRSIKKHKRFLSPLKMTTEKRMDLLSKKKSPDKNNPENQLFIPKGSSPFDPIVLRSGYPIVFDYEPKEQIRQERIPHGPLKTLYKNGDTKYEFRDGTVRIKTPNGFSYTYYTNGDKQQEFPDGVNAYRYSSNGSVEFRCPDKTLMYFFEDGQIEEHFSNGETRVRFPDRTEIKIFTDNTFILKDRNGVKKEGKIFNDHMKINSVRSPDVTNSSGISTPTPRKKPPISTNMVTPGPNSQDRQNESV